MLHASSDVRELTRSLPRDVYIRRKNNHPGGQHYCSRTIWATYGLHMGHIWGPVLQHMELFQHMGKKILQKAQHMGNIWVSFSNIWGCFETYRSFLKHMGLFRNIWGLSETYGAFRERSLFLFLTCHIASFRYMNFFFLKSFANHKPGLFPIFLTKKNVYWKFQGEPETCFLPVKAGKPPAKNFKLILRLRFCQFVCTCILRRRRPDCDLVWFFELRRGRLKSARMRKFKMSAARPQRY